MYRLFYVSYITFKFFFKLICCYSVIKLTHKFFFFFWSTISKGLEKWVQLYNGIFFSVCAPTISLNYWKKQFLTIFKKHSRLHLTSKPWNDHLISKVENKTHTHTHHLWDILKSICAWISRDISTLSDPKQDTSCLVVFRFPINGYSFLSCESISILLFHSLSWEILSLYIQNGFKAPSCPRNLPLPLLSEPLLPPWRWSQLLSLRLTFLPWRLFSIQ